MIFAGVDPGQKGAITIFEVTRKKKKEKIKIVAVLDLPTKEKISGKGLQVDMNLYMNILLDYGVQKIFIELITAMHQQGATSGFNYGCSFYGLLCIPLGMGIPVEMIRPQKWKKICGFIKKGKDLPREKAQKKWKKHKDSFKLVKHQDRADSAWIGFTGYKNPLETIPFKG